MTSLLEHALRGAQEPRVHSAPVRASSAGAEAVALARSAGVHLYPWQQLVLEEALGERADGRWAAREVGLVVPRQNGKGEVLLARELAGLVLFGEQVILHSAHQMRTAKDAFRRTERVLERTPHLRSLVAQYRRSNDETSVEFKSGARLIFGSRSGAAGRGLSIDTVILDEAYDLTEDDLEAVGPTQLAVPNAQRWYTSSAPKPTSDVLAAVRRRGFAGGDPSLCFLEWSAPDGSDLDDPRVWAQANPSLGLGLLQPAGLETERRSQGEVGFAREMLGIVEETGTGVLSRTLWDALVDRQSAAEDPVAFAVDAAPDLSSAAVGMAGARADGLAHVEVVDARPGVGWVPARLAELRDRWTPSVIVLDPGGPVGSLLPALTAQQVEVETVTARQLAQACGALHTAVTEDRSLRHLGDPPLDAAITGARKRLLGDAWAWRRTLDSAPLMAVTLALHGLAVHGNAGGVNLW